MPQTCKTCSYHRVAEVNALIIEGVMPIAKIAEVHRLGSESGLRRHAQNHVSSTALMVPLAAGDIGALDLLAKYIDALHDADRVREFAIASKKPELLLRASRDLRNAISYLMDHLGVTDTDITQEVDDANNLTKAVAALLRDVPALAEPLVDKLRELGAGALADVVLTVTETNKIHADRKKAS